MTSPRLDTLPGTLSATLPRHYFTRTQARARMVVTGRFGPVLRTCTIHHTLTGTGDRREGLCLVEYESAGRAVFAWAPLAQLVGNDISDTDEAMQVLARRVTLFPGAGADDA